MSVIAPFGGVITVITVARGAPPGGRHHAHRDRQSVIM